MVGIGVIGIGIVFLVFKEIIVFDCVCVVFGLFLKFYGRLFVSVFVMFVVLMVGFVVGVFYMLVIVFFFVFIDEVGLMLV